MVTRSDESLTGTANEGAAGLAVLEPCAAGPPAPSAGVRALASALRPGPMPARAPRRTRLYGALDLGTNNCRLLIAEPTENGFQVVDAFSRIVRLGEGLTASGRLSEPAMRRALDALHICRDKLRSRGVERARFIATEACRSAANGSEFLDRVRREVGLTLEIIDRETEARLAVAGCSSLIDPQARGVLLFDIGGGSSELVWLDLDRRRELRGLSACVEAWTSLPLGVVTLAERFGGVHVDRAVFAAMVADVAAHIAAFEGSRLFTAGLVRGGVHMLGTSGTVTTLAGLHLGLRRYDRRRVDGLWLNAACIDGILNGLLDMTYEERVASPCIGIDRADLVLAGCAILEAIRQTWPCERLRVADRGLREGILATLMAEDRRTGRRRRRRGGRGPAGAR